MLKDEMHAVHLRFVLAGDQVGDRQASVESAARVKQSTCGSIQGDFDACGHTGVDREARGPDDDGTKMPVSASTPRLLVHHER
jgi:hypothetical protein